MKRNKLSETQIVSMLNEAQAGVPAMDLCRKYKISSATFYKLKAKYSGVGVSELKRLKELEAENQRLKTMYANISLEHTILKDILEKYPEGHRQYPDLIDDN